MARARQISIIALLCVLGAMLAPGAAIAGPLPQPAPCVQAAAVAIAQRGKQYIWGAKGPTAFDCSGLTSYAWRQAGYDIGLSTYDQSTKGVAIPCRLSDLDGENTVCWQLGDLIFLRYTGGQHVAMYVGGGLFADAYNSIVGVIIHAVQYDDFYQEHFWQARRITDCGDIVSGSLPTPDNTPTSIPGLEEIPDILAPVSLSVPQCGYCNSDGSVLLPETVWGGTWPTGADLLNVGLVVQTVISWLAWNIGEIIRNLICWLLNMLQMIANLLVAGFNMLIYGVNAMFKLGVLIWLSLRGYFFSLWGLFEDIRRMLWELSNAFSGLVALDALKNALDAIRLLLALLGQLISLLGQLVVAVIGLVGWVGGLGIGLFIQLQVAIAGTTTPTQLTSTHVFYYGVRGLGEGLRDSQAGWALYVIWGMCYVAFVAWLARFLSASQGN